MGIGETTVRPMTCLQKRAKSRDDSRLFINAFTNPKGLVVLLQIAFSVAFQLFVWVVVGNIFNHFAVLRIARCGEGFSHIGVGVDG